MRMKLVAAGIFVVLAGGIAVVALGLVGGNPTAADLVPPDALGYVDVSLDPSLSQKRAIASLAERLPKDAQEKITEALPKGLNSLFEEIDLDYEQDVKPWLGDELAGFVHRADPDPLGAALLQTTDPEAALAAATKAVEKDVGPLADATHREVSYSVAKDVAVGVVGEYLVVGDAKSFKAVIDAWHDGGLSGSEDYSTLVGSLEPDRVVTYWANTPAILDQMEKSEALSAEERQQLSFPGLGQFQTALAGSVFATSESVVFEQVSNKPDGAGEDIAYTPSDAGQLGTAPASAWFGAVIPGVGDAARKALDTFEKEEPVREPFREAVGLELDDVLAWMGDGTLFVGGSQLSNLSGALSIASSDPAATEKFVTALVDAGTQQGVAVRSTTVGGLNGFEIADATIPARVRLLGGDRLVLAVDAQGAGDDSTATAGITGDGETLAEDKTFMAAGGGLGTDYAPVLFLDVQRATEVVKSAFGQSSIPPEFAEVEKYIAPIGYLAGGTREDPERVHQRLVIGTTDG